MDIDKIINIVRTLREQAVTGAPTNAVGTGQIAGTPEAGDDPVHNEKLDKQDRIDAVLFEKIDSLHKDLERTTTEIKKGCERDIRLVDQRLRMMEKKMWSIFGALTIVSFVVSPIGQRFVRGLTTPPQTSIIQTQ